MWKNQIEFVYKDIGSNVLRVSQNLTLSKRVEVNNI